MFKSNRQIKLILAWKASILRDCPYSTWAAVTLKSIYTYMINVIQQILRGWYQFCHSWDADSIANMGNLWRRFYHYHHLIKVYCIKLASTNEYHLAWWLHKALLMIINAKLPLYNVDKSYIRTTKSSENSSLHRLTIC